uniref:Uncharacterized protein n=1 Tax=Trieres chinensis TaxID=1514140 RepID=A0A7S2A8I1_TRICV
MSPVEGTMAQIPKKTSNGLASSAANTAPPVEVDAVVTMRRPADPRLRMMQQKQQQLTANGQTPPVGAPGTEPSKSAEADSEAGGDALSAVAKIPEGVPVADAVATALPAGAGPVSGDGDDAAPSGEPDGVRKFPFELPRGLALPKSVGIGTFEGKDEEHAFLASC